MKIAADKATLALVKEIGVCGLALLLVLAHLLGFLPGSDGTAKAAGTRVPVECFANGECRAMFPVTPTP